MKPHVTSAINAFTMIILGYWGLKTGTSSTAMIPIILGGLMLPLNNGIRYESKVVSHVAVVLTLVAVVGLAMALKGSITRGQTVPIARVAVMLFTALLSLAVFIKSFIDARKKRAKAKG